MDTHVFVQSTENVFSFLNCVNG